jgi:hypothetical protein
MGPVPSAEIAAQPRISADQLAVALGEGVRELPLHAHDLASVALEGALGARGAQELPLTQKPPEEILEGFYRERV